MGNLTQDSLKDEIRAGMGNRSDLDDRLTDVLNMVQDAAVRKAAAKKINFTELQTTKTFNLVASAATVTYEDIEAGLRIRSVYDMRIVQTANNTDSRKLRRVEPSKMDEIIPDALRFAEGTPNFYVPWDDKFEFFAIPDQIYNMVMRIAAWPTQFVEAIGTQLSDLDGKDDLLIYGAMEYLYRSLGEEEAARMYFVKYQDASKDAGLENEAVQDSQLVGVYDPHGRRGGSHGGDYWTNPFITRVRG